MCVQSFETAPAPCTGKAHTQLRTKERILPFSSGVVGKVFAPAENGYKARLPLLLPCRNRVLQSARCYRNRVSVRFPRRHTHRCGSTHPAVGWPATARPPPDLTQSAAASAPHTCRAAHALRPTHHSHPTIFAPPLQQRTLLHYPQGRITPLPTYLRLLTYLDHCCRPAFRQDTTSTSADSSVPRLAGVFLITWLHATRYNAGEPPRVALNAVLVVGFVGGNRVALSTAKHDGHSGASRHV